MLRRVGREDCATCEGHLCGGMRAWRVLAGCYYGALPLVAAASCVRVRRVGGRRSERAWWTADVADLHTCLPRFCFRAPAGAADAFAEDELRHLRGRFTRVGGHCVDAVFCRW